MAATCGGSVNFLHDLGNQFAALEKLGNVQRFVVGVIPDISRRDADGPDAFPVKTVAVHTAARHAERLDAQVLHGLSCDAHHRFGFFHRERMVKRRDFHINSGPVFLRRPGKCLFHLRKIQLQFRVVDAARLARICQIERVVRINGLETATPGELAALCGMSLCNMNRIIARLEQSGYARIIGKHPSAPRGRPSRLVRILL